MRVRNHTHGWPSICAFIDCDPNFMMYRRFGYLRTRLLTYQQDVMREMEENLDELDRSDYSDRSVARAMCCQSSDDKRDPPLRKQLFQAVDRELKKNTVTVL